MWYYLLILDLCLESEFCDCQYWNVTNWMVPDSYWKIASFDLIAFAALRARIYSRILYLLFRAVCPCAAIRFKAARDARALTTISRNLQAGGKRMASNYVDTTGEEGRFHGPHHHHHSAGTTPTGAAASSPRTMRRSFSSASSGGGHSHAGGGGGKCVCAPPTHAGSFKCRLHRTNSQGHGHGHPHPSPPTSPAAAPAQGVPSPASSRTVEAQ
jgi:hypothetical protein